MNYPEHTCQHDAQHIEYWDHVEQCVTSGIRRILGVCDGVLNDWEQEQADYNDDHDSDQLADAELGVNVELKMLYELTPWASGPF